MAENRTAQPGINPETTYVPVQGDCGHIFTIPIGRVIDGAEFTCAVCGQPDRMDEAALQDARAQLERLNAKADVNILRRIVNEAVSRHDRARNSK